MIDPSKIPDWLKLSPRYLFAVALCTGAYLSLRVHHLERLGLDHIDASARPWIGAAFLISAALLFAHLAAEVGTEVVTLFKGNLEERRLRARLRELSPAEKELLAGFIRENTKTRHHSIKSGVVGGLVGAGILFQSANLGSSGFSFAFNLQPWAWRYLREHPELLSIEGTESSATGEREDA